MSSGDQNSDFHFDLEQVSQQLHVRPEVLKRLVMSFSKTLSTRMGELGEALSRDDILKMRAILHEVKGTAGNLRLNDVHATADTMHKAVKAGEDKKKIEEYFAVLKSKAEQFSQFVEKMGA